MDITRREFVGSSVVASIPENKKPLVDKKDLEKLLKEEQKEEKQMACNGVIRLWTFGSDGCRVKMEYVESFIKLIKQWDGKSSLDVFAGPEVKLTTVPLADGISMVLAFLEKEKEKEDDEGGKIYIIGDKDVRTSNS